MKCQTVVNVYDVGTGHTQACHVEQGRSKRAKARAAKYLNALLRQDRATDVVYYVTEVTA